MIRESQIAVDVILANILQARNSGTTQQNLLYNSDNKPLEIHQAIAYCQKLKENGKKYLPSRSC